MKNRGMRKIYALIAAIITAGLLLTACGNKKEGITAQGVERSQDKGSEEAGDLSVGKAGKGSTQPDGSGGKSAKGGSAAGDAKIIEIDEEWMAVLSANGTMYDAFYALPDIMKSEKPDHKDDVKLPEGLTKDNYDYYNEVPEDWELPPGDMAATAGRWIPHTALYMGIETDYSWIKEAGVDFHLILNADGTGSCNMYGSTEAEVTWNETNIVLTNPQRMECTYELNGDTLNIWYLPKEDREQSWVFIRDGAQVASDEDKDGEEEDLGQELRDGKLYRLVCLYENGEEKKAEAGDPDTDPEDHFAVLVETDGEKHSGYGYYRDGDEDVPIYYQTERNLIKKIRENTADRSAGMGRTKFESEDGGKRIRIWPRYQNDPTLYMEYELADDKEEEIPVSHLAVGPMPDREFEIPEGERELLGFYRLDRIPEYMYYYRQHSSSRLLHHLGLRCCL